jgi:hypothetical protein
MSEICERLGISLSTATKHLRLLTLPVATQLAVHEGKISYANALADASKRGEGSTTGPRAGLRRSAILRAVSSTHEERPRPTTLPKSARQLDDLIAAMHGDDTAKARLDATALAWLTFYDCPPTPRTPKTDTPDAEPKRSRKKAPPRAGKQAEENDA